MKTMITIVREQQTAQLLRHKLMKMMPTIANGSNGHDNENKNNSFPKHNDNHC